MKNWKIRCLVLLVTLALVPTVWAQWSSDPTVNLALAGHINDQVQPKIVPLPTGGWYLSWFDNNPNGHPPYGYDVYVQQLDAGGVHHFVQNGIRVADLGLSSTEDYGLDVDASGFGLVAFLDSREGSNEQVTAAKISPHGAGLWGKLGVQLTSDSSFHGSPKIAATSDGDVVVAWISDNNVVLQRLDPNGGALWGSGIVLSESGASYFLADLHAADNGSVIVSWVRETSFTAPKTLLANKLSSTGQFLWGNNVSVYDGGSLQFGEFPYFVPDGSGGAVFAWYSSSPTLQCFTQHILADGTEAFPHNGSAGSSNANNARVSPSVSYHAATDETFLFWTEEDSLQVKNGVSGQKFNGAGAAQWGKNGLSIVPLGQDSQLFVQNVQSGDGAVVYWVDEPGFDSDTLKAVSLDGSGNQVCSIFPVSSVVSGKSRLVAGIQSSGLSTVTWQDDRTGDQNIYIQDVNPDCSLGYLPIQCSEVRGLKASCQNGTLNVQVNLNDRNHDGDTLTLQVNGTDQGLPIKVGSATFSGPGQGKNTVLLAAPASCVQEKTVQCP